jgi:hypothetical protein
VGAAWRAAYAGASAACARGLAALPGVSAVVLHRGAARSPEPGVSDLDFILVRGPLSPHAEAAWLEGLAAARRRLRGAFPMLGDLWVAEPAELERYLRVGGLRAWEDRPGWRILAGELPAPPPYEGGALRRRLDAWVWAFVAHMELTRRLLRPGRDLPEKREADARKMHADAVRRSAFAGSPGSGSPAVRPAADRRPLRALWPESAGALSAASEALAADAAEGTSAAAPWPAPAHGPAAAAERGLRSLGARALVLDAPYHTWAVFDDGASPERLCEAARALAAEPLLPGVPLALTASSWALLLQSSYLGAPLGGLDGPAVPAGDGLFAGWGPTSLGDPRGGLARLPAALRRAAAAEAAAWMAVWWRGLWTEESFPNRFVLYHLHVRAAQLSLARAGRPVPSAWDALLGGPALRFAREEPAACVDGVPRAALAPEHAAAVAAALRTLGEPA